MRELIEPLDIGPLVILTTTVAIQTGIEIKESSNGYCLCKFNGINEIYYKSMLGRKKKRDSQTLASLFLGFRHLAISDKP